MKLILSIVFLLFFSSPTFSEKYSVVAHIHRSAVKIIVSKQGTGSGVAVAFSQTGTLILTNDHVCQLTRGKIADTKFTDYFNELNTHPLVVENTKHNTYRGRVVFTSNQNLSTGINDDLCLVEIQHKIPIIKVANKNLEPGKRIISVGAPKGIFPLTHEGFTGPVIFEEGTYSQLLTVPLTFGSSGGGVFDAETGELVAVSYAVLFHDRAGNSPFVTFSVPIERIHAFMKKYKRSLEENKNAR